MFYTYGFISFESKIKTSNFYFQSSLSSRNKSFKSYQIVMQAKINKIHIDIFLFGIKIKLITRSFLNFTIGHASYTPTHVLSTTSRNYLTTFANLFRIINFFSVSPSPTRSRSFFADQLPTWSTNFRLYNVQRNP